MRMHQNPAEDNSRDYMSRPLTSATPRGQALVVVETGGMEQVAERGARHKYTARSTPVKISEEAAYPRY